MNLSGKVAVITGGAVRLGQAITLALAEHGCNVFIHYGQSEDSAQSTMEKAKSFGVHAEKYSADLTDLAAVQGIIPAAREKFGQIDILVNNAAIFLDEDTFKSANQALWEKVMNINLRAPLFISQAFANQVTGNRTGKIINFNDARLRNNQPDHFVYRLAKGGLWQLTEMLAHELAPNITVNAVALGAILPPPGADIAHLENIAQERVPLKIHGSAKIVTENVIHLLQQDFITGVTIPMDGGEFLN